MKRVKENVDKKIINPKRSKKKTLSMMEKVIMIVSIVIIVGSVLAVAYVYIMNSQFLLGNDILHGKLDASIATPDDIKKKSTNIMICGIDFLEGSSRAKLTDVIMVANVDFENGEVNVLQIPRDAYIGDDYYTGKINAIYSAQENGGLDGLAKKINSTFLIPIDNYVTLNMTGFRSLVDAVGGVEIDSPVEFTLEKITIKKGKQKMNGKQADRFVRNRKTYPTGDLMRNQMQAIFMKALMEKMFTLSFSEVAAIAPTILKDVTTDMTLNTMLSYYKEITKMGSQAVNFHQLEVSGFTDTDRLSKLSIRAKPTADLLNEKFRAHSRKFTYEELGIIEKVTNYPYEPPVNNSNTENSSNNTQ